MAEIQTTKDAVLDLAGKIERLISAIKPEKKEEKDISELIEEKFEELSDEIEEQIESEGYKLRRIIENASENKEVQKKEFTVEFLKKFNKERLSSYLFGLVITAGLTYLFFKLETVMFLLPFGFHMAFWGLLFLLYIDWKGTPNDSFAEISKHPVATAIYMLIPVVFFVAGISIASNYIPDSFSGEASQRIDERLNNIEKVINQGNEESEKQVPAALETDNGTSGDKGIPNR